MPTPADKIMFEIYREAEYDRKFRVVYFTELDDHFVIEIGSVIGGEIIGAVDWSPCTKLDTDRARQLSNSLEAEMRRRTPGQGPAPGVRALVRGHGPARRAR